MTAIFCKTIQVFMPFSRLHNSIYTVPYVNSGTDKRNCSVFQWWLYHFLSGILAVFLCLFRKKYVISANTVIVNRQFSLHQLPPLHKMGGSVCDSVTDNQYSFLFRELYLYFGEYFGGVLILFSKR